MQCFKEFIRYAVFNIFGMLGLSCYILADTFFISKGLGANGLAALNLSIPVYSFIHGSGLMLGMGGATKYSIQRNQQRKKAEDEVFSGTIYMGILFAAVFFMTGLFFAEPLTVMLGADEEVFIMSKTYLKVLLLFSPCFLLNDVILCFVRNDGAPQLSMLAMLGGSFSNIGLDYIFIFPMKMGIFGAVLATGLAPVISLVILSPFFLKKRNHFHFSGYPWNYRLCAGILAGGVPSLVAEAASGIVMIVFNKIMLELEGNPGVAAYGIIANISLVVIAVYTGLAQGMQPVMTQYYGKGDHENVRMVFKYGLMMAAGLYLIIYLGIFFGADKIAYVFNSEYNLKLQEIAVEGLRLYFSGCIFSGVNIVLSVYFTSTEHPKPAGVISLLRGFFVVIPLAFLLSFCFQTAGLWCAFPVSELAVTLVGAAVIWKNRIVGQ